MRSSKVRALSLLAVALLAGAASAQWSDNFDSYALNSPLSGQGGWREWDSGPSQTTVVTNAFSRSAPHSIETKLTSDSIHPFTGYTSGKWIFTAHQYLPSTMTQNVSFLMLSVYNDFGPYTWCVWLDFNPAGFVGQFRTYLGGNGTLLNPIVFDKWVEIKVLIDLDSDKTTIFYDGNQIGPTYSWTGGYNGTSGGPLNIGTVDLYSPTTLATQAAYYDDISLKPEVVTTPFCTAKAGLVCGTPTISFTGTPSATAASGFVVSSGPARSDKSGILLYNTTQSGAGLPFQGGTLCVEAMGLRRAGSTNSKGMCPPGTNCLGVFSIDMNTFAQGSWVVPDCAGAPTATPPNNPAAFLLTVGQDVYTQYWGRDSVATGSYVSSGLKYTVGP